MSRRKIKSLELRQIRQKITAGLTNKERQSWGENGQRLTKNMKPTGYFSLGDNFNKQLSQIRRERGQ